VIFLFGIARNQAEHLRVIEVAGEIPALVRLDLVDDLLHALGLPGQPDRVVA